MGSVGGDASLSSRTWGLKKNNFLCTASCFYLAICCHDVGSPMRLLLVIMLEIFARNLRRASWSHAFDTIHTWIGSALPNCC